MNWYLVEPMDTERKADGTYKQEDGKYLIPEKLQVCDTLLAAFSSVLTPIVHEINLTR